MNDGLLSALAGFAAGYGDIASKDLDAQRQLDMKQQEADMLLDREEQMMRMRQEFAQEERDRVTSIIKDGGDEIANERSSGMIDSIRSKYESTPTGEGFSEEDKKAGLDAINSAVEKGLYKLPATIRDKAQALINAGEFDYAAKLISMNSKEESFEQKMLLELLKTQSREKTAAGHDTSREKVAGIRADATRDNSQTRSATDIAKELLRGGRSGTTGTRTGTGTRSGSGDSSTLESLDKREKEITELILKQVPDSEKATADSRELISVANAFLRQNSRDLTAQMAIDAARDYLKSKDKKAGLIFAPDNEGNRVVSGTDMMMHGNVGGREYRARLGGMTKADRDEYIGGFIKGVDKTALANDIENNSELRAALNKAYGNGAAEAIIKLAGVKDSSVSEKVEYKPGAKYDTDVIYDPGNETQYRHVLSNLDVKSMRDQALAWLDQQLLTAQKRKEVKRKLGIE